MDSMTPSRITKAAAIICWFLYLPTAYSQSTAEMLQSIKNDTEAASSSFVDSLQKAVETPAVLESGKLKEDSVKLLSKLETLSSRINETADLFTKKETDLLKNTGLGTAEKEELRLALQEQKKPLESYRQKTNALQKEVKTLIDTKISSWLELYKTFSEVAGPEEAAEKLRLRVNEVTTPYLPPKPKPTPKATPTPPVREIPPPRKQNQSQSANSYPPIPTSGEKVLSLNDAEDRARDGDAYAQAVASIYYAVGYKVQKNIAKAADYAMRSVKQDHPLGGYRLACMIENGEGFDKNLALAQELKKIAFDGLNNMEGDPYAITALGIMLFRGEGGAPKLPSEAVRLYLIAADMGYAPAQYNYSAALALGQGVEKNDSESLKYWRAAYDQGYPPALSGSPTDLASGRNHKPQTKGNMIVPNPW